MKNSNQKPISLATKITIFMIAVIIFGCGYWFLRNSFNRYQRYTTADSGPALQRQISQYANDKKFTVLMNFKTGCSDCNQVHNKIIKQIKDARNNKNNNFVMVDSKIPSIAKYLIHHGITNTPTVAIIYDGHIIQQYSGDNTTKLNRLLTLKDMETGKAIPIKYYNNAEIENDEMHFKETLAINEHPNLNFID